MTTSHTQATTVFDGARQLNRLIEVCLDSEKDYGLAAADVREKELKHLFLQRERERASFVTALQRVVRDMGAFPENEGSAIGTAHRAWSAIVRSVRARDARTIVQQCIETDEAAMQTYENVLATNMFRGHGIELMLRRQRNAIHDTLANLRQRIHVH